MKEFRDWHISNDVGRSVEDATDMAGAADNHLGHASPLLSSLSSPLLSIFILRPSRRRVSEMLLLLLQEERRG